METNNIDIETNGVCTEEDGSDIGIETSDNKTNFLVDRGRGIRTVRYSAWRTNIPGIIGYGMTREEVIYDLVHNAQPV